MKSIASIALLANLSMPEIASAGISVSVALIFFASTGLMKLFISYIPLYIIRGIQLGTGMTLISRGIVSVLASHGWGFLNNDWLDNYLIAMLSFCLVMLFWRSKWTMSAFVLFAIGLIIGATKNHKYLDIGPQFFPPFVPSPGQFWAGFIRAGLGQLPLTISNSVIAVSILADDLFPIRKNVRTDVTRLSFWIAAMNLIGAWFGCIPYCCGVSS